MKKRLIKYKDIIKLIIVISLFVMASYIGVKQIQRLGINLFTVKKAEYKFYIKNPTSGEYEEQTGMTFPGEGYYLDVDKTNSECANSTIDQNDDLSVKALVNFSTICNLYYNPNGILTVTSNVSSAIATIKLGDEVLASGTVPVSVGIGKGKNVTITVSEPEYYATLSNGTYYGYEETFVMTAEDTTKNITLSERPWITGTTSNSSSTSAATKTSTNWHPGYYLVEVWGGKGGIGDTDNTTPGASGYIYGVVYIGYNTKVYSTAGGNGLSDYSAPSGGANGGGDGGTSPATGNGGNRGSGGGYSALAIGATTINSTNINNGTVKFIAGGGGGASAKGYAILTTGSGGSGGAGGTLSSTKSTITQGTVFSGSNGTVVTNTGANSNGKGGSTSGGAAGTSASAGSMLAGGDGYSRGGGGGAGYYGGGGGGVSNASGTAPGGGGGGSSFLASDVTYTNLPSSVTNMLTSSNPSSTGGAIKIQWIGKNMP